MSVSTLDLKTQFKAGPKYGGASELVNPTYIFKNPHAILCGLPYVDLSDFLTVLDWL